MSSKEKEKTDVSYEATLGLEAVLAYLDDLRTHLAAGELHVEDGSKELVLAPPVDALGLKFRAKSKGTEQSVRLDISWQSREPAHKPKGLVLSGATNGEAPTRTRKKQP